MHQKGGKKTNKKKNPGLIYEAFCCLDGSLHTRLGSVARNVLLDLLYFDIQGLFCNTPNILPLLF